MRYVWIKDPKLKEGICKSVLDDLPEWFGIPSAVTAYVGNVADKPFLTVYDGREPVGFYALSEENSYTLDMYVLGVKKAYHGKGIGTRLQEMVNRYARANGYHNLVVLTLAAKAASEAYKKTRSFYERMGFTPVYDSDRIWNADNPTTIYVLPLQRGHSPKGHDIFLDTGRLIIRPYRQEDFESFHRIFSDPEVMEACEPVYSRKRSETMLEHFISSRIAFAVEHKGERKVIGHLLFKQIPSEDEGVYEVGWIFNRAYWNQGYAFEASKAMIKHGFERLGVHKAVAETVDPHKSLALMKKLGMVHEATLRRHRRLNGEWEDLYVAGILARENHG